jgi:hypothetical protein
VLCLELRAGSRLTRVLASELAMMADATPYGGAVTSFLQHSGFPVDARHNAKILREELTTWAARRLPKVVRP